MFSPHAHTKPNWLAVLTWLLLISILKWRSEQLSSKHCCICIYPPSSPEGCWPYDCSRSASCHRCCCCYCCRRSFAVSVACHCMTDDRFFVITERQPMISAAVQKDRINSGATMVHTCWPASAPPLSKRSATCTLSPANCHQDNGRTCSALIVMTYQGFIVPSATVVIASISSHISNHMPFKQGHTVIVVWPNGCDVT